MITFLSSPKPFTGINAENQINAIKSWKRSIKGAQVILYGKAEGLRDVAQDLGVSINQDVKCNEYGTPLFDDIVAHAQRTSSHDRFVYINCDVIVDSSLTSALTSIDLDKFLMVGQRIDLDPNVKVDRDIDDLGVFVNDLASKGLARLHAARGSDYFGFSRGLWNPAPSVAIGRGGYDNVLIVDCLKRNIPVVNATLSVIVCHQFHDYSHIRGGRDEVFFGPEAKKNTSLLPPDFYACPESATFRLQAGRLVKNYACGRFLRFLYLRLCLKSDNRFFRQLAWICWKGLRCLKLGSARQYSLDEVLAKARAPLSISDL